MNQFQPGCNNAGRSLRTHQPFLIAIAFALAHGILAATVDGKDPELFLRADRAGERLNAIVGLLGTQSWLQLERYLASHGIIGDYAPHAVLYAVAGRLGVVIVQVALAILSGLCVHRLARVLGLSQRAAAVAMMLYLALPHTLVLPHQLATEALHVPLVVISTWSLAEVLLKPRASLLLLSALCLGAAILIRPIMLLWPLVTTALLGLILRPRIAGVYAAIALLPTLTWTSFIWSQTGEFGLGKSGHSMERNLYSRVDRIAATLPSSTRSYVQATYLAHPDRELSPATYIRFSLQHPFASLVHLGRDALNFFGKSGIERVTIDYLALHSDANSLQDPRHGWRRHLEARGTLATVRYLSNTLGVVFIVSIVGAILMAGLLLLTLFGAVHLFRHRRKLTLPQRLTSTLLVLLIPYVFVFSQVIDAMQSRHRAPAEFAIVLLATVGASAWRRRSA
ncbi:MAG: glycosyltransferase family 39 protein [Gammaproteobacteria bacterium]|nr:hypothetical protein [Gammaproteobacteria bacterium]